VFWGARLQQEWSYWQGDLLWQSEQKGWCWLGWFPSWGDELPSVVENSVAEHKFRDIGVDKIIRERIEIKIALIRIIFPTFSHILTNKSTQIKPYQLQSVVISWNLLQFFCCSLILLLFPCLAGGRQREMHGQAIHLVLSPGKFLYFSFGLFRLRFLWFLSLPLSNDTLTKKILFISPLSPKTFLTHLRSILRWSFLDFSPSPEVSQLRGTHLSHHDRRIHMLPCKIPHPILSKNDSNNHTSQWPWP